MLVIGGAGTIGSNYVKAALRGFEPSAMYVVDIDENSLTELTRELRAGEGYNVPEEYITEPIDLGSDLFYRFFKADVVAVLKDYLPNFQHIEKGKSLDSRM